MLQGYRTYIMVAMMIIYNVATSLGVVNIGTAEEFRGSVDLILNVVFGLLAIFFRFKAKPKGVT